MKLTTKFFLIAHCILLLSASQLKAIDSQEPILVTKTIHGLEANIVMQAMEQTGVEDTDKLIGAKNLKSKEISCVAPLAPHAIARCNVSFEGENIRAPHDAAQELNRILLANGGRIRNDQLSASLVEARNIHCVRPVVPHPQARCSFQVFIFIK